MAPFFGGASDSAAAALGGRPGFLRVSASAAAALAGFFTGSLAAAALVLLDVFLVGTDGAFDWGLAAADAVVFFGAALALSAAEAGDLRAVFLAPDFADAAGFFVLVAGMG